MLNFPDVSSGPWSRSIWCKKLCECSLKVMRMLVRDRSFGFCVNWSLSLSILASFAMAAFVQSRCDGIGEKSTWTGSLGSMTFFGNWIWPWEWTAVRELAFKAGWGANLLLTTTQWTAVLVTRGCSPLPRRMVALNQLKMLSRTSTAARSSSSSPKVRVAEAKPWNIDSFPTSLFFKSQRLML